VHLPLAFSIHHFVSSVGADAGFAAIVGLAILVLLYFAQARETSSLRDQSVSASERVAELERRLAQLGSAAVRAVGRPEPAEHTALAVPAAPAGVAAPALASATRLIPLPPQLAPAPTPAPAPATPMPAAMPASGVAVAPAPVTPPPATVAASAGGAPPVATPAPAAAPAASNGTGEHAVARPAVQPRPVKKIRPGGGYTPPPPPPLRPGRRGPGARRFIPIVVGVVLAGIAVAAILIVTSSSGNSNAPAAGRTTNAPAPRTKAAFKPSSVTVAVLNGTDVSQLAHRVALKLQHVGYKEGTVATASDQTHSITLVGYLGGHRHAAHEVARALGLSSASVAPADQNAQQVACPPSSSCRTSVIVTVGTDLSNTP
jgi:hypothetical protein